MFEFASPHFLYLLALIPLLAWRTLRRAAQPHASIQYSGLRLFRAVPAGAALFWRRFLPVLRLVALAFLIVALARPRFGTVERDVIQEGVDIFYCLDISGSMRAEDFEPNRLEKAKELTAAFSEKRPNDRQGIVVFAGEAFMLCPLTFDGDVAREFLRNIAFDDMGVDGTAIGMGMARALKKLRDSKAKSRVLVVMTDGENNAGEINPDQAADVAKALGVRVYTIGIGSRGITTVLVKTPYGLRRQRIETSIDEDLLRRIADKTGGIYRRAASARELESVLSEIDNLEKSKIEMKEYRTWDERMAPAAWLALALLFGEVILRNTRFLKIP